VRLMHHAKRIFLMNRNMAVVLLVVSGKLD